MSEGGRVNAAVEVHFYWHVHVCFRWQRNVDIEQRNKGGIKN